MADGDLFQADLDLAFAFARSEVAPYRNSAGQTVQAPVDAARFDHDDAGAPRGLLVTGGSDYGTRDRLAVDPLILPAALVDGVEYDERACTIFHAFAPAAPDDLFVLTLSLIHI